MQMKKLLTISSLLLTGSLFAGCTFQGGKAITNDNTMMSGNTMMMDNMNGKGCCSQSWDTMSNDMMMMHNVNSEEEFIVNMIPHHQEAVDTAKIIVAQSTNSELKQLAQNIIDAQTKEISMMQWWLKDWYPNSTLKSNYQNMMPELEALTGSALDSSFLQWMIMHHMWAIHMAQSVMGVNHRPETMELANNIITTQQQEISMMRNMLENIK